MLMAIPLPSSAQDAPHLIQTLLVDNEFVATILIKGNLFSNFFREKYRPIKNHSSFPNIEIIGTVN